MPATRSIMFGGSITGGVGLYTRRQRHDADSGNRENRCEHLTQDRRGKGPAIPDLRDRRHAPPQSAGDAAETLGASGALPLRQRR